MLNTQGGKEEIKKEIKKHLKTNENENLTYHNLGCSTSVPWEKFTIRNGYIKKAKKISNDLSLHFKEPEKEQTNPD